VTFEDHAITGGYGTIVMEHLKEERIAAPVLRVGWPDQFIEHASSVEYLREKYGLTAAKAVERVIEEFKANSSAEKKRTVAMA
jgi:1-deoxy-D-xylulose-5-phosphate synthase